MRICGKLDRGPLWSPPLLSLDLSQALSHVNIPNLKQMFRSKLASY